MMMPYVSSGGHVAPLLIALAVGYGVLILSSKEEKLKKKIGVVVGWLIMVVSFVGLICIAAASFCKTCPTYKAKYSYPMMSPHKGACVMPMNSAEGESPKEESVKE